MLLRMCSKLIMKTAELCHWHLSGVFIVNFKHISHFFLVFLLLLTLNKQIFAGKGVFVVLWHIEHFVLYFRFGYVFAYLEVHEHDSSAFPDAFEHRRI